MAFDGQNETCREILSHFQFLVSFHLPAANWKEFKISTVTEEGTRRDLEDGRRSSIIMIKAFTEAVLPISGLES